MENQSYTNYDVDFSYPIQWIHESEMARKAYQRWIWRSTLAKQGKPCRNTYQEELESNLKKMDISVREKYRSRCKEVPVGRSFALKKAVDNIAAEMSGGVESFNYQINDPFGVIDSDTEDLLSTKCQQDYVENRLEQLAPVFSDDIMWFGVAAAVVKYCPITDKNKVLRVHPKNIWFDTRYSSTGTERFRGYSTMISWAKLKQMIADSGDEVNLTIKAPEGAPIKEETKGDKTEIVIDKRAKYGNRKIRTLNGLDIYVDGLNKLATSPNLGTGLTEFQEYDHDLKTCYNLNYYQSFATDPERRTNSGYNGDDVELTVIYDLDRRVEYKIINRRFVIAANKSAFKRKIEFKWTDPRTGEEVARLDDFHLDCPLKFQFEKMNDMDTAPHPWAPVFPLLDSHDELCGWRARREHVSKILSILRIDTNGADAESLVGMLNIMGGIFDDLQGDVTALQFAYDYNPIDSEIAHLENLIQQVLHAYDQFDAMQAMGDRASAAESGMATFAVAQGLAVHQIALMGLFADIARQSIANRVAYSSRQAFPVINKGEYRAITIQQMALTAIIDVKPKLAKQIQEKQIAANALALLGTLNGSGTINKEGLAVLMEQALYGAVPRKMAETFVKESGPSEQELALAQQQAQNDAATIEQNQQMYNNDPVSYETENVMENLSPDEIDGVIAGLGSTQPQGQNPEEQVPEDQNFGFGSDERMPVQNLDMTSQDGAISTNLEGQTAELGAALANPNSLV